MEKKVKKQTHTGQRTFNKGARIIRKREKSLFNVDGTMLDICMEKNTSQPLTSQVLYSKWILDLNVTAKTIKF